VIFVCGTANARSGVALLDDRSRSTSRPARWAGADGPHELQALSQLDTEPGGSGARLLVPAIGRGRAVCVPRVVRYVTTSK